MLKNNVDITSLSNFKTKAFAKYFYEFDWNIEELKKVVSYAKKNNLKILPVSGGTNMLFAFDVFDGLVIFFKNYNVETNYHFTNYRWLRWNNIDVSFSYKDWILEVSAFENISDVAEVLYQENINKKWMRFIWLPWTIAGAVVGNAGCFGLETENHFQKAEVLNLETLEIETIKDPQFSYRNSIFKRTWKYLVLKAYFDLNRDTEKYAYKGSLEDILDFRINKQPSGNTCGSFFTNPSREFPAWKLIEEVGLKWYKLGWAFFSPKHANFLMSDGTATWQDLINLKNLAQKKVKEQFDIELVPEVRIVS